MRQTSKFTSKFEPRVPDVFPTSHKLQHPTDVIHFAVETCAGNAAGSAFCEHLRAPAHQAPKHCGGRRPLGPAEGPQQSGMAAAGSGELPSASTSASGELRPAMRACSTPFMRRL